MSELAFPETVRQYRLLRGMRQADLARRVGWSRSYVALVESGRYRPNNRQIGQLAQALGVTVDELMFGTRLQKVLKAMEA